MDTGAILNRGRREVSVLVDIVALQITIVTKFGEIFHSALKKGSRSALSYNTTFVNKVVEFPWEWNNGHNSFADGTMEQWTQWT